MKQLLATCAVIAWSVGAAQAGTVYYTVEEIKVSGKGEVTPFAPTAINNSGEVVGSVSIWRKGSAAVRWRSGTEPTLMFPDCDCTSHASDINENGVIVGNIINDELYETFYYSDTTGRVMVDSVDPTRHNFPAGINNSGQIAGTSGVSVPTHNQYPFLWDSATGLTNLGDLSGNGNGHTIASAVAINDAGAVVGTSRVANVDKGFYWTPETGMLDLGTVVGASGAFANDINDNGQIIGTHTVGGVSMPYIWSDATGLIDLGQMNVTELVSFINEINNLGQVVGGSFGFDPETYAFKNVAYLWESGTGWLDLNTRIDPSLGWDLGFATAINDVGQIVGSGKLNGVDSAFLLTPYLVEDATPAVPLPAGFPLLGAGLGALAFLRRRRG